MHQGHLQGLGLLKGKQLINPLEEASPAEKGKHENDAGPS
jgi:hypothetical protein